MKAIIKVDVPEFQIGQEVTVYYRDTMCIKGVCEKEEERKEGVWFHIETIDHQTFYEHRECGRECKMPENFCPKCGAKMRMSWECFDERE